MKKILLCLFVSGFAHIYAQSQLNSWFVNSQKYTMTQPAPVQASFAMPGALGGEPEYNSMCDNSGNLIFYLLGNQIFDNANNFISKLTTNSWMNETEVAIIPNPDRCNHSNQYFIVFCEANTLVTPISYGKLDMNTSTYSYVGQIGLSSGVGANCMAVSQVNANGERYLYFGAASNSLPIYKVAATGISPLFQNASPNAPASSGEMELSNAGDKLVYTRGTNPVLIDVVPLNPLTGLPTGNPLTYTTGSTNIIAGLELDNSGNNLYVSQLNQGVVVQSLLNPNWAPSTPILGTAFDHTQLEKSFNDYWILCASSTGIRGIIASSSTLDTWTLNLNSPLPTTYIGFSPSIFMMPDQIDGENYDLDLLPPMNPISAFAVNGNTVCNGATVNLQCTPVNGATSYVWQPGGLNGTSVFVNPPVNITYVVTASNPAGCTVSAEVTLSLINCCANPKPNSITLDNVNVVAFGTPNAQTWPVAPGYYTGTIALPNLPGNVNGGNYTIWGTLTINAPANFDNTDLAFNEAAGVTQNKPLSINHSWWHACSKMWQGINSKSYLQITNSIIEDASIAASLSFITNHPGLLVNNTVFNKNNIGIGLSFATVNTSVPNNFHISGSIFTCKNLPAATYNFPLTGNFISSLINGGSVSGSLASIIGSPALGIPVKRSEYGVAVSLSQATAGTFFNIGVSSTSLSQNSLETNYFDYLNAGIWNTSSQVYVVNCHFTEITNSGNNLAKGGIYHIGSSALPTVTNVGDLNSTLKQCIFENSDIGINAAGGGNLNIYSNNFSFINTDAIELQKWYSPAYNGGPTGEANILQNTFDHCKTDLRAFDNQSIKAIMQGNTSTYGVSGAVINEVAISPYALYRVDGNSFARKNTAIFIGNTSNANVTDNSIRLAPYTNAQEYGVYVSGSVNGLYSNNSISSNTGSNAGNPQVSGIISFQSAGNTYCSNDISKVGDCMLFMGQNTPVNLFSNSFSTSGPACLYAIHLMSANTGNLGVNSNNTWYANENVFGSFSNTNGNVSIYCQNNSNSPQASFYYSPPLATIGADNTSLVFSASSASLIPGGPLCASATFRKRNNNQNADPVSTDSLNYIARRGMFYLAKMYEQYRNLLTPPVFNACQASNLGQFYLMDSLANDFITTGNHSSLQAFENKNTQVQPENNIEENQQQFNAIYAAYLNNDNTALQGYMETLQALAQKCPITEGNAVFQARALLKQYDAGDYTNSCEDQRGIPASTSLTPSSVKIYPNPASKEVFVYALADGSRVEVYSLMGVKLSSQTLGEGENKINVSALVPGNYFFKIYNNAGGVNIYKVLVIN